jgi:hypothetical protein
MVVGLGSLSLATGQCLTWWTTWCMAHWRIMDTCWKRNVVCPTLIWLWNIPPAEMEISRERSHHRQANATATARAWFRKAACQRSENQGLGENQGLQVASQYSRTCVRCLHCICALALPSACLPDLRIH